MTISDGANARSKSIQLPSCDVRSTEILPTYLPPFMRPLLNQEHLPRSTASCNYPPTPLSHWLHVTYTPSSRISNHFTTGQGSAAVMFWTRDLVVRVCSVSIVDETQAVFSRLFRCYFLTLQPNTGILIRVGTMLK